MLQYKLLKYLINKYPKLCSKLTQRSKTTLKSWVNYKLRKERLRKSKQRRNKI